MMFGGFRVQYTFPNMESIAMVNENSYKIGKKREKNRELLVMMLGGFRVQCAFPNMEIFACLDEKWL